MWSPVPVTFGQRTGRQVEVDQAYGQVFSGSAVTGSQPRRSASMLCVVANVLTGGNASFWLAM